MKQNQKVQNTPPNWGIFLQSDGSLIDISRSYIGALSKVKKWSRGRGERYLYIEKIDLP